MKIHQGLRVIFGCLGCSGAKKGGTTKSSTTLFVVPPFCTLWKTPLRAKMLLHKHTHCAMAAKWGCIPDGQLTEMSWVVTYSWLFNGSLAGCGGGKIWGGPTIHVRKVGPPQIFLPPQPAKEPLRSQEKVGTQDHLVSHAPWAQSHLTPMAQCGCIGGAAFWPSSP